MIVIAARRVNVMYLISFPRLDENEKKKAHSLGLHLRVPACLALYHQVAQLAVCFPPPLPPKESKIASLRARKMSLLT